MKPLITGLGTGLDNVVTAVETPLRPKKLSLRVSGARRGSEVRPVTAADELAGGVAVAAAVAAPRFGMRVVSAPVAPIARAPLSPEDYATAEDYE